MDIRSKILIGSGVGVLGATAFVAYRHRVGLQQAITAASQSITQTIENTTGMEKPYFTIAELCASSTAKARGIDNTPTPVVVERLQALIDNILDPARRRLGKAIIVSSGYRCPALNAAVGGVSNSQHLTGMAADLVTGGGGKAADMNRLFEILVGLGNFDQLIWEHPKNSKWIHVSYNPASARHQILDYNGKYTNITNNWQSYLA